MRIARRGATVTAVAVAAALALSACSNSGGNNTDQTDKATSGGGSTDTSEIVIANGTEPQNPLLPSATNEVGGGRIIDLVYGKLVYYAEDGSVHNEQAESISSDDGQNWTIKIKSGLKFTNDEALTAQSFVDAWNYAAYSPNGQLASNFFAPIEGYAQVAATKDTGEKDEDGNPVMEAAPEAETMSGLKVVDDTTFTVKLSAPEADFPLRLGYSAYSALPASALKDMTAFGENPASSGPYMLAKEGAWQHNVQIDLIPNPDFTGDRVAQNKGVRFVFYANNDAAYTDLLADNLDVLDQLPDSALDTWQTDLGDRGVNQPAAIFQSFTIPERLKHFSGEEGKLRRAALSMAIDRDQITQVIFSKTRTPATDFTSPVIAGWSDTIPGSEVLKFDAEKAKDLWAQADKISKWEGTFEIAYNGDGPHQGWVDAVCNSVKNNLGIDAQGKPYPTFAEFRKAVTDRTIQVPFRTGWQADYPSAYNFLYPLYSSSAADGNGSNDGDYKSADFDKLIDEGASSADVDAANKKFSEAQEVLFKDLPALPLWYQNVNGGYSNNVQNVKFDWKSVPIYNEITKTAK